jgi:hypothetical protein
MLQASGQPDCEKQARYGAENAGWKLDAGSWKLTVKLKAEG